MTKIFYGRNGNIFHVSAKGHATGSEQCCAAISAILYSLADYVNKEKSITIIKMIIDDANVVIDFKGGVEAESVYYFVTNGFIMMEESYKDYVSCYLNNEFAPLSEIFDDL